MAEVTPETAPDVEQTQKNGSTNHQRLNDRNVLRMVNRQQLVLHQKQELNSVDRA